MAIFTSTGAKVAISREPNDKAETLADFRPELTGTTFAFTDTDPDTITDSDNGFVTAGFKAGDKVIVSGSSDNDGSYEIETVAAGTLTLKAGEDLTTESAGATVTLTADKFVEIGEAEGIEGIAETANEVTFTSLTDGRQRIGKGTATAAQPSLNMALDLADEGQQILADAGASDNNSQYMFRITLNDQPAGGTKSTTLFGRGFVMEYSIQGLAADDFIKASSRFGATTKLIRDNAA